MEDSGAFLNIDTPENVVFGYELAGLGSRFLAAVIDVIGLAISYIIVFIVLLFAVSVVDGIEFINSNWIAGFFVVLSFIIFYGYHIFFELIWSGQTPGKRIFGLRAIGRDGLPLTLAANLLRNLVRTIDFLPLFYTLGSLVMFFNKQGRRLGDMAAGTLVVHEKKVSLDDLNQAAPEQIINSKPTWTTPLNLPVHLLSAEDLFVAENFLQRRLNLFNAQRMLRPILNSIYAKMGERVPDRLRYGDAIDLLERIIYVKRNGEPEFLRSESAENPYDPPAPPPSEPTSQTPPDDDLTNILP